ncbi:MAG: hypothetical protein HKP20_04465 [Akkermansiaceae bacterium]|nr:hypothetical protein [Akkermansiaceae bacterium]
MPERHGYDRCVVWFRGTYNSYTNFDTEVVGLFQNQLKMLDHDIDVSGGSLTWASIPGQFYRITASADLQSFPHEAAIDIQSQGGSTSHTFTVPSALSGSERIFLRVEEQ